MSNLQQITLYMKSRIDMVANFDADYSAEYSLLLEWGGLCPTLEICMLPCKLLSYRILAAIMLTLVSSAGTAWYRVRESIWFPPIIALDPGKGSTAWLAIVGTSKGLSILREIGEGGKTLTVLRAMHERSMHRCA